MCAAKIVCKAVCKAWRKYKVCKPFFVATGSTSWPDEPAVRHLSTPVRGCGIRVSSSCNTLRWVVQKHLLLRAINMLPRKALRESAAIPIFFILLASVQTALVDSTGDVGRRSFKDPTEIFMDGASEVGFGGANLVSDSWSRRVRGAS